MLRLNVAIPATRVPERPRHPRRRPRRLPERPPGQGRHRRDRAAGDRRRDLSAREPLVHGGRSGLAAHPGHHARRRAATCPRSPTWEHPTTGTTPPPSDEPTKRCRRRGAPAAGPEGGPMSHSHAHDHHHDHDLAPPSRRRRGSCPTGTARPRRRGRRADRAHRSGAARRRDRDQPGGRRRSTAAQGGAAALDGRRRWRPSSSTTTSRQATTRSGSTTVPSPVASTSTTAGSPSTPSRSNRGTMPRAGPRPSPRGLQDHARPRA